MAILRTTQTRQLGVTFVTVVSALEGVVYYHWYIDGAYIGQTLTGRRSFALNDSDQVRIVAIDTTDVDFDAIANAPAGYPARRTLNWIQSSDPTFVSYVIRQRREAEAKIDLATKAQDVWHHELLTPRLDDLTDYSWFVYPVNAAGNEGDPLLLSPDEIVRTPDAPNWSFTFDAGTDRVTFAAAA